MWDFPLALIDHTRPTLAENLALDEALLDQMERAGGPPLLRLWECPQTGVVLGRSSRVTEHVNLDACRSEGIPVLRRCSGGGVVVVGPGCLEFSLILPSEIDGHRIGLQAATRAILARIAEALSPIIPGIEHAGTSDLTIDERKFSGNAQRWLAHTMLHHGTLLLDFPIPTIERLLKLPPDQPEYRAQRRHSDFLRNLHEPPDVIRRCLTVAWRATASPPDLPWTAMRTLVETKYDDDEWNLRR